MMQGGDLQIYEIPKLILQMGKYSCYVGCGRESSYLSTGNGKGLFKDLFIKTIKNVI